MNRLLLTALAVLPALNGKAASRTGRLVLVRHGQSTWNEANVFTGWADPPLTPTGWREAARASFLLDSHGIKIDTALCSTLQRTSQTLDTILAGLGQHPRVARSWRLNEQSCGALTGWNKRELAEAFGEAEVHSWRRDPHRRPPPATDLLSEDLVRLGLQVGSCLLAAPASESLLDACHRYRPLWARVIVPLLQRGKTVLVVGHGNMLRGAVREIEGLSDEQLMALEIPNCVPMVYEFDKALRPRDPFGELAARNAQILRMDGIQGVLLGDPDVVRHAQARSAAAHTTNLPSATLSSTSAGDAKPHRQ